MIPRGVAEDDYGRLEVAKRRMGKVERQNSAGLVPGFIRAGGCARRRTRSGAGVGIYFCQGPDCRKFLSLGNLLFGFLGHGASCVVL